MSPIAPAEFARRFLALDDAERARFVAALWRARGWETAVEGDVVVASRGEQRTRLRIVAPRLLGSPDLSADLDVLVAAAADESLRAAAEGVGARYVDPAALRDLLCYGISRGAGDRLAQDHLGCSLLRAVDEKESPTAGDRSWTVGVPGWLDAETLRTRLPEPGRVAIVLAVLAVVVVAAVAPGTLRSPEGPPTASVPNGSFTPGTVGALGGTTSPTPNGSAADLPPGLSPSGVTDPGALATATVGGLAGQGWVLYAYREGPDRTVWRLGGQRWTQTVRVEDAFRYRYTTRWWYRGDNGSRPSPTSTVFQEPLGGYVRENTSSWTRYHDVDAADVLTPDDFQSRVRTAIVAYLATDDTQVECVATRAGADDCIRYRVVATGTPRYLSDAVGDYRATATVTDSGVVRSLGAEYTVPDRTPEGERERVRFGFSVRNLGDVAVADPEWLDEARANGTATAARPPATASPRTDTDGFVTDLSVYYYLVSDGVPERVSLSFSYDEYGTARITPPAWLSDVRTDDARHSSATPENATEPSPTGSIPVVTRAP